MKVLKLLTRVPQDLQLVKELITFARHALKPLLLEYDSCIFMAIIYGPQPALSSHLSVFGESGLFPVSWIAQSSHIWHDTLVRANPPPPKKNRQHIATHRDMCTRPVSLTHAAPALELPAAFALGAPPPTSGAMRTPPVCVYMRFANALTYIHGGTSRGLALDVSCEQTQSRASKHTRMQANIVASKQAHLHASKHIRTRLIHTRAFSHTACTRSPRALVERYTHPHKDTRPH